MKKLTLLVVIIIFAIVPVFSLEVNPTKDSAVVSVDNKNALNKYKLNSSEKVQTNWKN